MSYDTFFNIYNRISITRLLIKFMNFTEFISTYTKYILHIQTYVIKESINIILSYWRNNYNKHTKSNPFLISPL